MQETSLFYSVVLGVRVSDLLKIVQDSSSYIQEDSDSIRLVSQKTRKEADDPAELSCKTNSFQ